MKERFIDISTDAEPKQEKRFETWLAAEDVPFTDDEAAEAYRDRVTLIKDAIQLKNTTARIPICPSAGFFPAQYACDIEHRGVEHYLDKAFKLGSRLV
jgi:hypothetical protein